MALLLDPQRAFTLTELSKEVGVSLPTVQREVVRAAGTGVVSVGVVGRARQIRANTASPYFEPLARLLLLAFGPLSVVREHMAAIPGTDEILIFGSWAARYLGQSGEPPRDLDVLVIGSPDRDAFYAAADRIERIIAMPVQVTFRTAEQWRRHGDDPFLTEVRKRALVGVLAAEARD